MSSATFIESLERSFTDLLPQLNGTRELRQSAWDAFVQRGLPTRKWEEWKYSPIAALLKHGFTPRTQKQDAHFTGRGILPELKDSAEFFVNDFYRANAGATTVTSSLTRSDSPAWPINLDEDPFVSLNRALALDGAVINIEDSRHIERPIYLAFITGPAHGGLAQQAPTERWLDSYLNRIVVGNNAYVRIIVHIIHQDAEAENMGNMVSMIDIGDNSNVELAIVNNLRSDSIQLTHTEVSVGRSSTFTAHAVCWGSKFARNNLNIRLTGEDSEANLYGLYTLSDNHHLDNRTLVEHAVPNCLSNELYKGILDEKATSVFNGKIMVRPDAQKTNAFQSNPNILLSDDATVNSKPQLEIFADDVKCTHGATVGHLDEEALFYLRSRGLGQRDARHLLIEAFAEEVLQKISVSALREHLSNQLHAELQIP